MTQEQIAGTRVIAEYMGYKEYDPKGMYSLPENIVIVDDETCSHEWKILDTWNDEFKYSKSLDSIAPVVKKIRDELKKLMSEVSNGRVNAASRDAHDYYFKLCVKIENLDASIYNSCVDLDIPSMFPAVVAAIQFINEQKKEI